MGAAWTWAEAEILGWMSWDGSSARCCGNVGEGSDGVPGRNCPLPNSCVEVLHPLRMRPYAEIECLKR